MKHTILYILISFVPVFCYSQKSIRDESITNQQERMVFKQWDRSKFTPTSGWLGINPYYWLTWGLHPNYPKTDLRPLGPLGPQTIRLGSVAAMQGIDKNLEKETDTLRAIATAEIYNQSGIFSATDPLWILYYSTQFKGLLNFDPSSALAGLPIKVKAQLVSEGSLAWLEKEIQILQERLEATRTTDQDRGSRILSYHRMLGELRKLLGLWESRKGAASRLMEKADLKKKFNANEVTINSWTPASDLKIAKEVLDSRKY